MDEREPPPEESPVDFLTRVIEAAISVDELPIPPPRCIGCGYCCDESPCYVQLIARKVPNVWSGCPDLLWDGHRHWCGLYRWRKLWKWIGIIRDGDRCIAPRNPYREVDPFVNRTAFPGHITTDFPMHALSAWINGPIRLIYGPRVAGMVWSYIESELERRKGQGHTP